MGYSNTTKLALRKDDGNESIVNWRDHNNSNLDLLDATVGNLVDAINNAKLLLGQLGYDQNGDPIVDAATARDTLDAAQSEDAAGSLYDAEQAIGVNAGNIATNAAAISSLQDSVSWTFNKYSNVTNFYMGYDPSVYGIVKYYKTQNGDFLREIITGTSIAYQRQVDGVWTPFWTK